MGKNSITEKHTFERMKSSRLKNTCMMPANLWWIHMVILVSVPIADMSH